MNEAAWCYLEGFGGKKDKVSIFTISFSIQGLLAFYDRPPEGLDDFPACLQIGPEQSCDSGSMLKSLNYHNSNQGACKLAHRCRATPLTSPCIPSQPSFASTSHGTASFQNKDDNTVTRCEQIGLVRITLPGKPPNTAKTIPIQRKPYGSIILWAAMHRQITSVARPVEMVYLALVIACLPITNYHPWHDACEFISVCLIL